MKPNIHPKYNTEAKVVCACGQTFATGSTMAEIHTEICSNCHPFYTGKQNLIDTAGRVDRFQKLTAKAAAKKATAAERKSAKAASASGGKKAEKVEVATDKK